jgi:hypothetical protein
MAALIFLLTFQLFLIDLFLLNFIPTNIHSNLPSFIFLGPSLSQYDFNHGGLLNGQEILGIFAPIGIILNITLLLAHAILLNLNFPGAPSRAIRPLPFNRILERLTQLRDIKRLRRKQSQIKPSRLILLPRFFRINDVRNDHVESC